MKRAPIAIVARRATAEELREYARVPIAFTVDRTLDIDVDAFGTTRIVEYPVAPYVKDYDALEAPPAWAELFDVSRWGVIVATSNDVRVGGAVLAYDTPGVDMLGGRGDRAVLWDLRVDPAWRGHGVGRRLFDASMTWARARACRELIVETQNVNATACRFYARMGGTVHSIEPRAYPGLPHETRVLYRFGVGPRAPERT